VVLVFVSLYYFYIIKLLHVSYKVYPLQELIDLLAGVRANTFSILTALRWQYAQTVFVSLNLFLSFFVALALSSFINTKSFFDIFYVKHKQAWKQRIIIAFIASFVILFLFSFVAILITLFASTEIHLPVTFFSMIKGILFLSLTFSLFVLLSCKFCKTSFTSFLFFAGYFLTGTIVHKLADISYLDYKFKYLLFTKTTLSQSFNFLNHSIQLSKIHYVPLVVLLILGFVSSLGNAKS
jgi:hypothetical protein